MFSSPIAAHLHLPHHDHRDPHHHNGDHKNNHLSDTALAGIFIASAAVSTLLIAAIILLYRKHKRHLLDGISPREKRSTVPSSNVPDPATELQQSSSELHSDTVSELPNLRRQPPRLHSEKKGTYIRSANFTTFPSSSTRSISLANRVNLTELRSTRSPRSPVELPQGFQESKVELQVND